MVSEPYLQELVTIEGFVELCLLIIYSQLTGSFVLGLLLHMFMWQKLEKISFFLFPFFKHWNAL